MDDLISRKALLAAYDRVHIGEPGMERKLMEDAPTVDAVEVVHGWWITVENREYLGVRCSNCQKWFDEKTNYCPNCGARMKEGNENG